MASSCHLLGVGLLSVITNIADTGSTVTSENEREDLTDKIIMGITFLHVLVTFGACAETKFLAAFANLTPLKPLGKGLAYAWVIFLGLASCALLIEQLPARSAIKATCPYWQILGCRLIHKLSFNCYRGRRYEYFLITQRISRKTFIYLWSMGRPT